MGQRRVPVTRQVWEMFALYLSGRYPPVAVALPAPADDGRKLRMVFLYVRGQSGVYYMFGEGSGADGLIDAIGGYDVAHEIGWNGMKPITDEGIVDAQPDLVLMMTKGLESAGGVDGLLDRLPALASPFQSQAVRIRAELEFLRVHIRQ